MAVLANFTPDDITWTHVGISGVIKAGEKKEFDEGRANFILNKFGKRGLVKLEFSEDPEYMQKMRKLSRERYERFWKEHIYKFNQFNETLKNEGKAYIQPDRQTVAKAEEFGIKLIGPWKVENTSQEVALKAALDQISSLQAMVATLSAKLESVAEKSTGQPAPDWNQVRQSFWYLSRTELENYRRRNLKLMKEWPSDVLTDFSNIYEKKWSKKPILVEGEVEQSSTATSTPNEA